MSPMATAQLPTSDSATNEAMNPPQPHVVQQVPFAAPPQQMVQMPIFPSFFPLGPLVQGNQQTPVLVGQTPPPPAAPETTQGCGEAMEGAEEAVQLGEAPQAPMPSFASFVPQQPPVPIHGYAITTATCVTPNYGMVPPQLQLKNYSHQMIIPTEFTKMLPPGAKESEMIFGHGDTYTAMHNGQIMPMWQQFALQQQYASTLVGYVKTSLQGLLPVYSHIVDASTGRFVPFEGIPICSESNPHPIIAGLPIWVPGAQYLVPCNHYPYDRSNKENKYKCKLIAERMQCNVEAQQAAARIALLERSLKSEIMKHSLTAYSMSEAATMASHGNESNIFMARAMITEAGAIQREIAMRSAKAFPGEPVSDEEVAAVLARARNMLENC